MLRDRAPQQAGKPGSCTMCHDDTRPIDGGAHRDGGGGAPPNSDISGCVQLCGSCCPLNAPSTARSSCVTATRSRSRLVGAFAARSARRTVGKDSGSNVTICSRIRPQDQAWGRGRRQDEGANPWQPHLVSGHGARSDAPGAAQRKVLPQRCVEQAWRTGGGGARIVCMRACEGACVRARVEGTPSMPTAQWSRAPACLGRLLHAGAGQARAGQVRARGGGRAGTRAGACHHHTLPPRT